MVSGDPQGGMSRSQIRRDNACGQGLRGWLRSALLGAVPDKFIRIKLRRISREVKGLDSRIASKELLDELGSAERASVSEKDNRAFEVARKVPNEYLRH